MRSQEFLNSALRAIQDRVQSRDQPNGEKTMGRTVQMFNTLYGTELTEEQGWTFMELLKIVRSAGGKYRGDDYVDRAGYAGLAGEAASTERINTLSVESDDESSDIEVEEYKPRS